MLRLAFINELFYPSIGGIEKRFHELGKALVERGHEIHVFTLSHEKNLPKMEQIDGMKVHRFIDAPNYCRPHTRHPIGAAKFTFGLSFKLLTHQFDAYFLGQWPLVHSLPLGLVKTPLIFDWSEVLLGKSFLLEKIVGKTLKYHSTVSKHTRERLINNLAIEEKKISHIPNGVHSETFRGRNEERRKDRIIYVGRLAPHKRIDLLIEVFETVKSERDDVELYILGEGVLLPKLKQLSEKIEGLHVTGRVSEEKKINLLSTSSLFTSLSEREGFGISVLEALAAGTPAVVADFPNNAASSEFSGGTLTVPPKKEAIAEAIVELLANKELWGKHHKAAITEAQKYSWTKIAEKFERFVTKIINNSSY